MKLVSLRNKLRSIRLVWVTVVALETLLNDKYKLESLQGDGSRTRQEIPQTAGWKARACNCYFPTKLNIVRVDFCVLSSIPRFGKSSSHGAVDHWQFFPSNCSKQRHTSSAFVIFQIFAPRTAGGLSRKPWCLLLLALGLTQSLWNLFCFLWEIDGNIVRGFE